MSLTISFDTVAGLGHDFDAWPSEKISFH